MNFDTKLGIFGAVCGVAATVVLFDDGLTISETIASLMIAICILALFLAQHIRRTIIMFWLRDEDYILVRAEVRDLKHVYALATKAFGENSVTTKEQTKRLLYRNRDIFWVLIAQDSDRAMDSIAGYICLIPMDSHLCDEIEGGRLNVNNIDTNKLPRRKDPIDGIYIGAVLGTTKKAKGQILGHLITKAEELANDTSRRCVYARAGSKDGLRLLCKHDFVPTDPNKAELHALFKKQLEHQNEIDGH